jgi:hypothetical protein
MGLPILPSLLGSQVWLDTPWTWARKSCVLLSLGDPVSPIHARACSEQMGGVGDIPKSGSLCSTVLVRGGGGAEEESAPWQGFLSLSRPVDAHIGPCREKSCV